MSKPDILLLDEPTNHLDITAIEWLEKYLKCYPKSVVIVSHDRMFIDRIVNKVYEIEYASIKEYKGNYTDFEKQKRINYEKQLKNEKELSKEDKIGPSIGLFQVIPYNEEKDNSEIYKLNIPRITCLLKNYLSRTEQLMQYRYSEYYGISVYNELIKFTTTGWSADKLVDVRGFCSMRDHKALMLWRLRFLQEERKIDLEEIIEGYMEIYELMSKSIMIIVKHNYSAIRKQKSLEYVEKYLKKCEKQEELLLIRLIEVLNSVID